MSYFVHIQLLLSKILVTKAYSLVQDLITRLLLLQSMRIGLSLFEIVFGYSLICNFTLPKHGPTFIWDQMFPFSNQSHVQPLFQVRLGPTHFTTITCGKMFPFSNKTHRQPNSSLLVLVSIINLRKIMRTQVYLLCNDQIRPIYLSIKVKKVRKRMIMGNLKTLPVSHITQKYPFVT